MAKPSDDLFSCFSVEATELINKLTGGCLALEKADHEADLIDNLNRLAHSLKGAARLVELFRVSDLAHGLEDLFAQMGKRGSAPTTDEVTGLLEQVDELKQLVEAPISDGAGRGCCLAGISWIGEWRIENSEASG